MKWKKKYFIRKKIRNIKKGNSDEQTESGRFFASYQQTYIAAAVGNFIEELINNHSKNFIEYVSSIPDEKADFAYAESKWTVKELLQHMIDTERVFTYRILRLVRKEAYAMPGFEQDIFAANAHVAERSF